MSCTPVFKEAGDGTKVPYTIVQDITERKNSEMEFKKNAAILNRAQSIAHIGTWAWDLRTNEYQWSDEMFRMFGYEPEGFPADQGLAL